MVASDHGDGRVVVVADSDLFGDDCIGALDHAALWMNIANWTARRAGATEAAPRPLDAEPGGCRRRYARCPRSSGTRSRP